MNTVKESNLGEIKSVFNDNSSNAHYYKIIHKNFHGVIHNLEFAKPIIQVNRGVIIWQSNYKKPYLNYATLSPEKKQHIDQLIQDSINEMSLILGEIQDKNFLDDIIEIPNEDAIFYTKDADNNINIILTEWGFIKDEHIRREGVLKKIFSETMKSFIIKFKSNTGEFLEGINSIISTQDFNQNFTSNSQGLVKLNNLKKSDVISISSPGGNFQEVQFKVNATEEYTITVQRTFQLTFKVLDSNNKPVVNQTFSFISDQFPEKNFQTDANGLHSFQLPEKDGYFEVSSTENDIVLSESLPNKDKEYIIIYDSPHKELETIPLNQEEEIPPTYIELEFLNWRRKPISNQIIHLYGKNGKTTYTTNNEGIVIIDTLNKDIEYSVFMKFKGTDWKKEFIHKGEIKHSFIVKMRRFLWWWIPFILFFLLLLLIPTEITHQYTVLDKSTKQPIDLADVSSSEASIYQVQSYNDKTDSLGKLSIDYGKAPLYKQIFKKPNTDIFVSKSGYESLNTKVPLGYFKTTESIVYLNKLPPTPVPPKKKIILPCGGENYNDTGNQIKYFDLGKPDSYFLFEYYNDAALDIINVHCQDGTLLFTVDTTTNTTDFHDSKNIYAPCRYIYVEVIGTSNWGIRVNCPK